MREKAILLDLTKKGLAPIAPSLSLFEPVRLMNLRPDADGLHVEYMPSNSNSTFVPTRSAAAGWHSIFAMYDNNSSEASAVNNAYILHNKSDTWALTAQSFEVSQSTTPPSLEVGTRTILATFTKDGLVPPCVISSEGVHLISDGFTTYELSAIDSLPNRLNPIDVPRFTCGCYYNGQFIVGNIPTWDTKTGNSQAMIAWSDIGNTNFVAGTESVINTCADQAALTYTTTQILSTDNTIGFAQLPPTAEIIGMHVLSDRVWVLTADGVYTMTPFENTWSITRITRNQCLVSCLGDESIIFIDKSDNTLYSIGMDGKISQLGYSHIFGVAPNARYQLRYFQSRKAYQIYQFWWSSEDESEPTWENNFLLNSYGMYQIYYKLLIDEYLPKYQKYATYPDILHKDVSAINNKFLIATPLRNNLISDGVIGFGPTDFNSSDSTSIRMMKLVGRWNSQKVAGDLKGIDVVFSNRSDNRYMVNVDYAFAPIKTAHIRDLTFYPQVSGKVLYWQIVYNVADRLINEDIVLTGLELSLIYEGAQHRRGQSVNTTNA